MDPLAFVGLVEKALGLTDKLISDGQAQRSREELEQRIGKANYILSKADSDARAGDLAVFVNKLCLDAGELPGGDIQRVIRVPVSHFSSLIEIAAKKIKTDRDLAAADHALRSK